MRFSLGVLLIGTRYKKRTSKGKTKANHFRQFLSNDKKKYLSLPTKYMIPAGRPIQMKEAMICPKALNTLNIPWPWDPRILANIKNAENWKIYPKA